MTHLGVTATLWSLFLMPFYVIYSFTTPFVAMVCLAVAGLLLGVYCVLWRGKKPDLRYQPTERNTKLVKACPSFTEPYYPTLWGEFGDIQSTMMGLLRPGPQPNYKRKILTHPDGATIAVDTLYYDEDESSTRPLVAICPGITGGGSTPYVRCFAEYCRQFAGWNVVVLNHRGCSGHSISTPELFQMGNPHDYRFMVEDAHETFPNAPIIAIGYSLGANIVANFVCRATAEELKAKNVIGAISMCQGYDGNTGVDFITENRLFYSWVLTKKMTGLLHQHKEKFHAIPNINLEAALKAGQLKDFERHLSCPIFNYATPADYYIDQSCISYLRNASIPLLLINALDDPLIPHHVLPWETWKDNPNIIVVITQRGGHLGFAEGFMTPKEQSWIDRVCMQFTTALLASR